LDRKKIAVAKFTWYFLSFIKVVIFKTLIPPTPHDICDTGYQVKAQPKIVVKLKDIQGDFLFISVPHEFDNISRTS
jgi:hypothetical protein